MTSPDELLVDARGARCPHPVIELARAAARAPSGARIRLLASDPAARHDVPAFCRMRGHRVLAVEEAPDGLTFVVEVG